jgi:hypothetical protein
MRPETLKQLQEVVGNTMEQTGIRNGFLNKGSAAKRKMNKWDCIKPKSFCTAKKQSPDPRSYPQNGRKSLPAIHPVRD